MFGFFLMRMWVGIGTAAIVIVAIAALRKKR
jgi:hypothetical protein